MYCFKYKGIQYFNYNLEDSEVVKSLVESGIPLEIIESVKNTPKQATLEERIDMLENIVLMMMEE